MFKIRTEQKSAFQSEALRDFEDAMLEHLKRFSPAHFQLLGDDQIRIVVQLGLVQARRAGFPSQRDARYWIEMMLMLGSSFHVDPLLPWVNESLTGSSGAVQGARIDHLHARAWDYVSRTRDDYDGAENRFVAELRRIGEAPNEPLASAAMPAVVERATTWVARIFPKRCACAGESAVREAVERGVELTRRHDVATERGTLVVVALIFVLGSGFATDPLVPWASAMLGAPTPSSASARAAGLFERASACVDVWWS